MSRNMLAECPQGKLNNPEPASDQQTRKRIPLGSLMPSFSWCWCTAIPPTSSPAWLLQIRNSLCHQHHYYTQSRALKQAALPAI